MITAAPTITIDEVPTAAAAIDELGLCCDLRDPYGTKDVF